MFVLTRLGLFIICVLAPTFVLAVPRMSMTAGTPCATCHVNPSGSGLRTDVGFDTSRELALVSVYDLMQGPRPLEKNMGEVFSESSHQWLDNLVSTGIDVRLQWAHLGEPKAVYAEDGTQTVQEPNMSMFPMQIQPYLRIGLGKEWSVYGSYALGPDTHKGEACDTVFEGQSCFDAALQYENEAGLTVRTGMIQPTIGMRWDDHTILTRGDAAQRRVPIIPPNYAEWGIEGAYQPVSSFRSELGVFHTQNLAASVGGGPNDPNVWPVAYLLRLSYLPHFQFGGSSASEDDWDDDDDEEDDDDDDDDEEEIAFTPPTNGHVWVSASLYGSHEFNLVTGTVGVGLSNGLAVYTEVSHSIQGEDYTTLNGMLGTAFAFVDYAVPSVRVERAQTDTGLETFTVEAFVASIEFFPFPFVEIRPEYRIVKTKDYLFGQPTVQLHIFY